MKKGLTKSALALMSVIMLSSTVGISQSENVQAKETKKVLSTKSTNMLNINSTTDLTFRTNTTHTLYYDNTKYASLEFDFTDFIHEVNRQTRKYVQFEVDIYNSKGVKVQELNFSNSILSYESSYFQKKLNVLTKRGKYKITIKNKVSIGYKEREFNFKKIPLELKNSSSYFRSYVREFDKKNSWTIPVNTPIDYKLKTDYKLSHSKLEYKKYGTTNNKYTLIREKFNTVVPVKLSKVGIYDLKITSYTVDGISSLSNQTVRVVPISTASNIKAGIEGGKVRYKINDKIKLFASAKGDNLIYVYNVTRGNTIDQKDDGESGKETKSKTFSQKLEYEGDYTVTVRVRQENGKVFKTFRKVITVVAPKPPKTKK